MKKKKAKKKFNNLKKSIKNFIRDEEGFVNKANILKIGLGTISALGLLGMLSNNFAGHTNHASHNSTPFVGDDPVPGTNCLRLIATHMSHSSHANHPSY